MPEAAACLGYKLSVEVQELSFSGFYAPRLMVAKCATAGGIFPTGAVRRTVQSALIVGLAMKYLSSKKCCTLIALTVPTAEP